MIQQSSEIANNSSIEYENNEQSKIQNKTSQAQKKLPFDNNIFVGTKISSNQSSSSQSSDKPLCINKICPKMKNIASKSSNSKIYAFDPDYLCDQCLIQYKKQAFCLYCKQIYFDSSDDGKQWILCDDCGRWVHSQCANYDPVLDSDFKCIKCKKIQPSQNITNIVKKVSIKPTGKVVDRRKLLAECSLNSYGFYWQLGPKQLAEDMDKIRQYLH